ncbi:MAG: mechanosensitive ion channel domain-containing protein, partial [Tepidisphaeraceae bacterium]
IDQGQEPLAAQAAALRAYASRYRGRFVFHALLFIALAVCLRQSKSRVDGWVKDDPNLKRTAVAFDLPLATAAVLTIAAGAWIYPQAPQLLWMILFAVALVPAVILLRRLMEPRLAPALYALIVFYFVDQVRVLLAAQPVLSRLLFIAQMLGGLLFTVWFIRSGRLPAALKTKTDRVKRKVIRLAHGAAILFGFAAAANIVGYVALADLIGDATLSSAYVGVVFYALTRIADGLLMSGLRARPLAKVRMAQHHRQLIWQRARRVVHWVALGAWALLTLEMFSLRAPLLAWVRDALGARYAIGSLVFSPGHVLALGLTMWAAVLLSRFLRFVLEEDVYPRFQFGRGVPYAISTILHYAILVAGFLLTIAALGYDLTTITVLAGAFGVGIAFGMQNIVNNFVSGLILLFERPVQVGDVIQLDDATVGTVTRIGIRASIIRMPNGAAVIVPNGLLISGRVTNWTLSSSERRIDVPIAVVPGSDPKRVIELLEQAAAAHPLVETAPPPEAVFVGFAPGALNFELRAWTQRQEEWTRIRSDIAIAANEALSRADIVIR